VEYVQYKSALQGMLTVDWGEPRNGPGHAKAHFEAASRLCREDPRLPFAYGLLLWKLGQPGPAIAQFEQGAKTGKVVFLPALQAAAWCRILQRDVPRGGAHLTTLARVLAAPPGDYPSPAQKERAADWLGQTVGYMTGAGRTAAISGAVEQLEKTIAAQLEGPLREAYDGGRGKSSRLFDELQAIAARPENELRRELGDRRQKLQDDLGTVQPELSAARTAVKLNRDALAQLEAGFRGAAQQRNAARLELRNLAERVEYLSIPHGRTEKVEVREFEEGKGDKKGKWETRTVKVEKPETDKERAARLAEREQAIERLDALRSSLPQMDAGVRQAREEMTNARREKQHEYQELHARVVKFSEEERRLKGLIRQYEEWEESPARFQEHIRSLPPYVPWSIDEEKERVLESYPRRVPAK
jgi:hypothetical protein